MRFANQTELPSYLFRGVLDPSRIAASCAVRVTYDWRGEQLVIAKDQPWIVSPAPWESPIGPMSSDELFYRGGVDLLVCGSAHAPGGRPATQSAVDVRCGDFRYRLNVFGDRVWVRQRQELVPSAPKPFTSLPLSIDRSFGGRRPWDGIDVIYPDNPGGRGYYLSEEDAEGQPLANFEHPDAPVRSWSDQPEPVGVGLPPPQFGPRVRKSLIFDDDNQLREFRPSFFNQAFPDLILPPVKAGDLLELNGVDPYGPLALRVPEAPVALQLELGSTQLTRIPSCDQIGVLLDAKQVFVSYRYAFRYVVRAQEPRFSRLIRRPGLE